MLGLLVIIVISWVLLHFIEKKNIDVLGIVPTKNRTIQFFIGFVMISLIVLLNIYIETIVQKIEWKSNAVNYSSILSAFVYHLKSALTEDLVFRGALLYILIQRIGATKAILLSTIVFGAYHWFSYGILNERIILLVYVFMITGMTGYVWAYTYHKTNSIIMPLAFHLGYNLTMSFFYEAQPYGELLFSEISKVQLTGWGGFFFSFFKGLFPSILTLIFVKILLKKNFSFLSKPNQQK